MGGKSPKEKCSSLNPFYFTLCFIEIGVINVQEASLLLF